MNKQEKRNLSDLIDEHVMTLQTLHNHELLLERISARLEVLEKRLGGEEHAKAYKRWINYGADLRTRDTIAGKNIFERIVRIESKIGWSNTGS